jgi:hypothetical protein
MAHRQFTDPDGVEWTVYDVIPRADDRRHQDRRDVAHGAESGHDERRAEDRRATVTARPVRLTRGWLCFESSGERRRLQPIPDEWQHSSDADLATLLQRARVAPRRAG